MTNHWIDYQHTDVALIIGANPAENHPIAFKWLMKAKDNGGKIIVVDPRYTKSASVSDLYAPLRPGTDIPFLLGMINYAIENNLYHREYVVNYTNASFLIHPDFKFEDGLFSGFLGNGKYDTTTWQYQQDGDTILKDPTLQNPNCVFQLLKKHVARYDIKTVCSITGTPEDLYRQVCELFCSTGQPGKAGNIIYAMGVTQHTYGSQNVRATAMLQLLLGNIGIPGGGVNAQRGESNVQGATDMAMLYHLLPGYLGVPTATAHPTFADYIQKETPASGYWSNKPKFLVSQLKAWYGEYARPENDFCYDYLPKTTGGNHSHIVMFDHMLKGIIKGMFIWGQNPIVGGPAAIKAGEAMDKLDWMVGIEMVETETVAFWKRPGADPTKIGTECFLLPAAAAYEKEGSISNSGRWIQWRWKAIDPPGEAHSDLWIVDRLFKAIRKEYQAAGGVFPDPILRMNWDYGEGYPDIGKVAVEINGYDVASGTPLTTFGALKDDGSTACGVWIYAGYYADYSKPACKSRVRETEGIGLHKDWAYAWPLNRRIVYNRASCDLNGRPWNPDKWLVRWDGSKWETRDVPDFGIATDGVPVPPDVNGRNPFIMQPEGVGRLFAPGMKEGPFPEHYEPIESPVWNIMSGQQHNPCAVIIKDFGDLAPTGSSEFPYIITTHRLIEHYQSGALTRNSPFLVELMPEMFVTISKELASKLGISPGEWVIVSSARGEIKCKAHVSPVIKPLKINGQTVEILGLPWHWGFQGLAPGATANDLSPAVGDANTSIPESKAFLGNIRKA